MKLHRKLIWFLISGLWLAASECAQIVNPSGGPKDTVPPKAIKYIPDSAAINFNSKNITIQFNEFIQLSDLQKQLLISPPMLHQPDVKVKGKMLFIQLKDTLKKNTTYTFNFGNSIRDFREGNAAQDFQYIFSTGNFIDSLQLSGTVKNAFNLKAEAGMLIMLYDADDDSLPYKKIPSYFAKTTANGSYKINNIRTGVYKAFALRDANANYLYDSPEEMIGFCDSLIVMSKNTSLNFKMFKEVPAKQKLKRAYVAGHGHLIFAFAKPVNDSLKLNFLSQEPKENVVYEYSKEKDTLHYWFADDLKDTIKIIIKDGKKFKDTVRLRPITLEQEKNFRRGNRWELRMTANAGKDKIFDLNKELLLQFNHPIKSYDTKKIIVKRNNLLFSWATTHKEMSHSSPEWQAHFNSYLNKCSLEGTMMVQDSVTKKIVPSSFPLLFKDNDTNYYSIFIPPATFTDIFGLTNDTIKINFKTQEEKFYGTLKLNMKIPTTNSKYILQLLDEKENVVKEDFISGTQTLNYNYLAPGTYTMKIIFDENRDGKWTTGNYLQKKQAEKIIYNPKTITIRSNWDLELDWQVE